MTFTKTFAPQINQHFTVVTNFCIHLLAFRSSCFGEQVLSNFKITWQSLKLHVYWLMVCKWMMGSITVCLCWICLTLFYKNNFYKNSQPQIWYFEIGILKNIHARCKLIRKTKRGDHKKHFKHIIQGGSRLKTGQNRVQK